MIAAAEEKRKSGTQNVNTCRLQGGDKSLREQIVYENQ
jgi:hypothetical protein